MAEQRCRQSGRSPQLDQVIRAYFERSTAAAVAVGDSERAVAALEADARNAPTWSVDAYVQAANIFVTSAKPDWRRAEIEAEKALAVDKENPDANYIVGIAKANQGDAAGGLPYVQRTKVHTTDPHASRC